MKLSLRAGYVLTLVFVLGAVVSLLLFAEVHP